MKKWNKRITVLVLLLALFIPATVFSHSGDGDIPEKRTSAYTSGNGPVPTETRIEAPDWRFLWYLIVRTLFLLP
ncbi:MAG: hypothetical protein ABIH26_10880 [Candidatus Eisenbacteria bacterium]